MVMNKKALITILTSLPLMAMNVNAEMNVRGEIDALLPTLSKSFNDARFANIDNAEVSLSVNPESGCSIVSNRNVARRNNLMGDLSCVFEWTDIPSGISAGLLQARGIVSDISDNQLSYQISFFSGQSEEKVVINSEDINLDLEIPEAPKLVRVETEFSHDTIEGLTPVNYSLSSTLKEIRITVEPRKYTQKVELAGLGRCEIPVDEILCTINKSGARFGTRDMPQGYSTHPININSLNGFFPEIKELYTIAWDYRSPIIETFAARLHTLQANDTFPATKVLIGETEKEVPNGQAMVVVRSPYEDSERIGNMLRYSADMGNESAWVKGGTEKPVIWDSSLRAPTGFGYSGVFRYQQRGDNGIDSSSLSQCIQVTDLKDDDEFTFSMAIRANIGTFDDDVIVRIDTGCQSGEGQTGEEHRFSLTDDWQEIELTQVLNTSINDRVSVHIYGDNGVDDGEMFFLANAQLERGNKRSVHIPTMANPRVFEVGAGDWIVPENVRVTFEQSDGYENPDNGLTMGNRKVVEEGKFQRKPQAFSIESDLAPQIIDNSFVYIMDISDVENGVFQPIVYTEDKYANFASKEMGEVKLDSKLPTIRFHQASTKMENGDALYFPEDIVVVAEDEFIGGAEVTEIRFNGKVVEMDASQRNYALITEYLDLERGDEYSIEATVIDQEGNQATESLNLVYMPTRFEERITTDTAYQYVQNFQFSLLQREGRRCRFVSSKADAIAQATYVSPTCYLTVDSTEITVDENSSVPSATGVFQTTGTKYINYVYTFVNAIGAERVAAEGTIVVEVVEPDDIQIDLMPEPNVNNEVFSVNLTGGNVTTARVTSSNGPITFKIVTDGEDDEVYEFGQRAKAQTIINGRRINAPEGDLWEERVFKITAFYTLKPELVETSEFKIVYVPSRYVRGRLESDFRDALNTDTKTDTVKVGMYDRAIGDYVYDESTMGKWRGFLALREGDGTIIPLTPEKDMTDGQADFDVDISKLGLGSMSYVGVLNLVSELEGYTKQIITNRNYIRVWKGTQLNGGIKAFRLFGKVPFTFLGQYRPDSFDDSRVLGGVKWEITQDEVTWEEMPTGTNERFIRRVFDEPGVWKIRAVATNKLTGEESVTEEVEVTAFNTPTITIIGPSVMYYGETQEFRVLDRGEEIDGTGGIIEWSYDGEEWVEGDNVLTHTVEEGDESFRLFVRMRYEDTDSVDRSAYDSARKSINVKPPSPPRILIKGPFHSEVGKEVTFTARTSSAYAGTVSELLGEWTLPDGTTVEGVELTITTPVDWEDKTVKLEFKAWHKGLEATTTADRSFTTNGWRYEFPDYDFVVRQQTKFAPSQMQIFAQRERVSYPDSIYFETQFTPLSDMKLEYEGRNSARFVAEKPGVHTVRVTVKDSRGNEVDFIETIEVVEADPPEVTFRTSFNNRRMREPLDVIINAGVRLQHYQDKVDTYQWYVDDVLLPDSNARANVFGLPEGQHVIKLVATTDHGHVAEEEYVVDVIDNKTPTCKPRWRVYAYYTRIDSMCTDEDGRMTLYEWEVDGKMTGVRGSSIQYYYPSGVRPDSIDVRLIAYDDSNESSETTFNVNTK